MKAKATPRTDIQGAFNVKIKEGRRLLAHVVMVPPLCNPYYTAQDAEREALDRYSKGEIQ